MCFDSSELEEELLKALLIKKVPTILFVMNNFKNSEDIQIKSAINENRVVKNYSIIPPTAKKHLLQGVCNDNMLYFCIVSIPKYKIAIKQLANRRKIYKGKGILSLSLII